MKDYVPVNVRIVRFYERYPEGVITTEPPEVKQLGDRCFIESRATVYKQPHSEGFTATAWEPYPGKTPYTRDSEAMNAETSAVGRALALAGIEVSKSVASADEIAGRQQFADTVKKAVIKNRLLKACLDDKDLAAQIYVDAGEPETLTTSELVELLELATQARRDKTGVTAPGDLGWPSGSEPKQ